MEKKQIMYIMFDFDGTIVDSMPFLENIAVSLLMEQYGFSRKEGSHWYRKTSGLPFIQQMDIIAPNKTEMNSRIVNDFERMKIERIYEQDLFGDSLTVIKELKERGYKLGISSGTMEKILVEYLKKKEIDLFDDLLGWKPGFEKGAHHFNYVKKRENLDNSNLIFIGDSLHDARRAKKNNISFIGKIGMFKQKDFEKIISDIEIISDLSELLPKFPILESIRMK